VLTKEGKKHHVREKRNGALSLRQRTNGGGERSSLQLSVRPLPRRTRKKKGPEGFVRGRERA